MTPISEVQTVILPKPRHLPGVDGLGTRLHYVDRYRKSGGELEKVVGVSNIAQIVANPAIGVLCSICF